MDTERAGRQVVEAVRARRAEVILTPAGQIVSRVAGLFPGMTSQILHQVQRLALPAPPPGREADGDGTPGHALTPALPQAFDRLTAWGQAAAIRFNERRAASGLLSGAAARSPLATTTTRRN